MPSRRTLLGTAAAGCTLALGGCVSDLTDRRPVDGYVQLKAVVGVRERDGTRESIDVVSVTGSYEPNDEPPDATVAEAWADRFPVPRAPVVSDSLHDALAEAFDEVRYVVGVTSPEWADEDDDEAVGSYNVATTRRNFNRVQVHTAVTAGSDGTSLTIHSVDGLWDFEADG
jgi:hypothetical protein